MKKSKDQKQADTDEHSDAGGAVNQAEVAADKPAEGTGGTEVFTAGTAAHKNAALNGADLLDPKPLPQPYDGPLDENRAEIGRLGKIARLPKALREELNRRLQAQRETGVQLLRWLNGLPEVQEMLAKFFEGRPINPQNLSQWKDFGYWEWFNREEYLDIIATLMESSRDMKGLTGEPPDSLGDMLSVALEARYAEMLTFGQDPAGTKFQERLERLRLVCSDIAQLRRGDHRLAELGLKRAAFKHKVMKEAQEVQSGQGGAQRN